MTEELEIDSGINNPDQRENFIESIRLQAKVQGLVARVYANSDSSQMKVIVDGEDEGRVLAFAAAVKSWTNRREREDG